MSFNSQAAKCRPGQTCLPWPKGKWSGLDDTIPPTFFADPSLALENRNPSNLKGSSYTLSLKWKLCVEADTNVPPGMVVPSENVKSFTATRVNRTIKKISCKIYQGEGEGTYYST